MKTICRDCQFSIKIDDKQTGCYFNRLEKFKKAGIKVEEEENYFSIEALCNLCYKPQDGLTLDKAVDLAQKAAQIKVDLIIQPKSPVECADQIKQIQAAPIKPSSIIVLNQERFDLTKLMPKNIPWNIVSAVNSLLSLDDAIDKVKSEYFSIDLHPDKIKIADNALNEQMKQFFLLHGDGYLINTKAFRYFVGRMENFPKKLLSLPPELNITDKLTYTWGELCQQ